ncbi:MAG: haloacid dehalogenase, type II [Betaproteobacteria bacterium RIFCSPLOWO2_02_FULL_63_19]|nr:MAG: haloacid dehalogenase, type II [Betaproteobacteria bacterium RIFCSPLOWO2_02_FULL_63_19]
MAALRLPGIKACVFDAYGTLFDVASAAAREKDALGAKWQPLAELWRAKQLQYTWLRGLMGRHADFWQVTRDALDFALASLDLEDQPLRERLMALYLELQAYPEVKDTLARLKANGMKLAILSNGEPKMLAAAARNSGIADLLDAVLSVEEVQVFKPHPSVYRLPADRFGLGPQNMCFVSSNGWDAHAAKAFGYRVIWCNRFAQAPERIPQDPDGQIETLAALPGIVSE